MTAQSSVLKEADDLINGERNQQYGDAKIEFCKVAHQWATYLWDKYGIHVPIEAEDICWMMADLKKVRQSANKKRDNVVDAAGYIGLIEKVGAQEAVKTMVGSGIQDPRTLPEPGLCNDPKCDLCNNQR